LFFETDFGEEYRQLLDYIRQAHSTDFGWFIREFPVETWPQSVDSVRKYFADLKKKMFMFSTTAVYPDDHPKDNLYMWGHYGNGHRGVAIEFNTTEISQPIVDEYNANNSEKPTPERAWTRIDYEKKLPVITCSIFYDFFKAEHYKETRPTKLHQYYDFISQTKSLNWSSENEWRLLWQRDDTRARIIHRQINERAIERVYLGLCLSKGSQDDIIFETRQKCPMAAVLKAEKRHGAFALDFKPVS
jgi:hypothetical protein